MPTVAEGIARFALSVSVQVVLVAVICAGLVAVVAMAEQVLVLGLIAAYLATAVLLASLASPELAFVAALVGIFVSLMMQFTATERRSMPELEPSHMPVGFRLLLVALLVWIAWSMGLFERPIDGSRFATIWLVASAGLALATSTDPFKVGTALLLVLAGSLLYFATSTSEASLFVVGLICVAAFAISLTTSHLALVRPAGSGDEA
ncbi:MAG: hypothetical protein ACYC5O_15420 [Anaerolineae bacterium]